jgi:fructose-1-phosphate kinase PfkB-like protein
MPTINVQADVSIDVLVQAAEQLSETELRHFTSQILALNAKRTAPSVAQAEAELLVHINGRLPEDVQRRYDELIAKRDAETLSDAEHAELLRLTEQVEAFDVARVEALSQLAARRGVTLSALMRQLGIEPPADE